MAVAVAVAAAVASERGGFSECYQRVVLAMPNVREVEHRAVALDAHVALALVAKMRIPQSTSRIVIKT